MVVAVTFAHFDEQIADQLLQVCVHGLRWSAVAPS